MLVASRSRRSGDRQAGELPSLPDGNRRSWQHLIERYERIELPKVKPVVTRVERYGATCSCCGACLVAPVSQGLEPGSPFGPRISALAGYLRHVQAIGYQRLSRHFADLYGLAISEGAIANRSCG